MGSSNTISVDNEIKGFSEANKKLVRKKCKCLTSDNLTELV